MTNIAELAGDICDEIRLFLFEKKIEAVTDIPGEGYVLVHHFAERNGRFVNRAQLFLDGDAVAQCKQASEAPAPGDDLLYKKLKKRSVKICVYQCLKDYFKREKPWGNLTGIRPTKLLRDTAEELGMEEARRLFRQEFDVSVEKLQLAEEICANQKDVLDSIGENSLDVYIGIPFCVTKCAYCSFASSIVSQGGETEAAYQERLLWEIEQCRPILEGKQVRSVYIGGGTPTSFSAALLRPIVEQGARLGGREFTVEAGRPDTITEDKLRMLRDCGVDRISINAQTTNDATLRTIGREHTAAQFFEAFRMARQIGFSVINTDLIAGLPGEGVAENKKSLADVLGLGPENITVHTLAIKRASKFGMENAKTFAEAEEIEDILERSRAALAENGYAPYYMYRQKYMAGNMENVGYAKPGAVCVYNIDMMEEACSILALGAGAISKRIYLGENRIERAPNVKDIASYLERTDEMVERKRRLFCP